MQVPWLQVECRLKDASRAPAGPAFGVRPLEAFDMASLAAAAPEATVEGLYISPLASAPMESRDEVELLASRGIEGDRYCTGRGTYSVLRSSALRPGEREPGRQVSVVSADSVEEALAKHRLAPPPLGALRRNVVVRGVSASELVDAIGSQLVLGDACVLFVHRAMHPSMYLARKLGCPRLMDAIWDVAGVACEVLDGGPLRVGAKVAARPNDDRGRLDAGRQFPGYYCRPSQRTDAVLAALQDAKGLAKAALERVDPRGVARLEKSFAAVKLKFFPRRRHRAFDDPKENDRPNGATLYDVLGVRPDVGGGDLRKAFKSLALKHHPDRADTTTDETTATMAKINGAYEVLSDPVARAKYDATANLAY